MDVLAKVVLVPLAAQTCYISLLMNDNAYRIFILSSAKASICIVTAIDWMNCSVVSQLPSKVSGSATLAFLISWPPAGACMLVRIVHATADAAWEDALATSSGASNI